MILTEYKYSEIVTDSFHADTIGSIENAADVERALDIILGEGVVAVEFPGTGGLLYRADSERAVQLAMEVKAGFHRKNNPVKQTAEIKKTTSLILNVDQLAPIVQVDRLPKEMRALFWKGELRKQKHFNTSSDEKDPQERMEHEASTQKRFGRGINAQRFREKISGMAFLKLPIFSDARVEGEDFPEWTYSQKEDVKYIHALAFNNDPKISKIIRELRKKGVHFIGATSMNYTGEPEVVDHQEEAKFAQENDLFFLENPDARNIGFMGSYNIVNAEEMQVERKGNLATNILNVLLGKTLTVRDDARDAHYPVVEMDDSTLQNTFRHIPSRYRIKALNRYVEYTGEGLDEHVIQQKLRDEFIHTQKTTTNEEKV